MTLKRNRRQMLYPFLMVVAGIMLIISAAAWMISSTSTPEVRSSGIPASGITQPSVDTRIPYPGIQRVSVGDARAALELKQAIFIDVRGEPYFSAGHIPDALSITEEELLSRLGELDGSAWIITYCT
jgi:hypothetical protein